MPRNYVRPEISPLFLRELLGKRQILINPDWAQIERALAAAQKSCRKNTLTTAQVREAWNTFQYEGYPEFGIGNIACPRNYGFDMECTIFQAVEITSELTGVLIGREQVAPGTRTRLPVNAGPSKPLVWRNEVVSAFWTHLDDAEIESIYRRALLWKMTAADADSDFPISLRPVYAEHVRRRRELQLAQLFRGIRPEFVSEFSLALREVANHLEKLDTRDMAWSEFKAKWPSLATRYQRNLLGLVHRSRISLESVRQYIDQNADFDLSLDFWGGPQRIFAEPQIVFRVTACRIFERLLGKSRTHRQYLAEQMKVSAESMHPSDKYTVGWLRVHVDAGNRIIFIDEVQSDLIEAARADARLAVSAVAAEIAKSVEDWLFHGFATVQHWSRTIQYRVAIHSRASAAKKAGEGMTQSERKWNTYYQALIRRFGLEEQRVAGYPGPICVEVERPRSD